MVVEGPKGRVVRDGVGVKVQCMLCASARFQVFLCGVDDRTA